ncbi:hypothetical protein E1A91_A10G251300v1, partial [Gossypium mustelinum]
LTPSPKSYSSNFLKSFSDIFQSTLLRTTTSFGGARLIYLLSCYIKDSLTHTKPDSFLLFLRTSASQTPTKEVPNIYLVGAENETLPYWLSNTSALLCLLQKNLRSNGFLSASIQCSGGNTGFLGRVSYLFLML